MSVSIQMDERRHTDARDRLESDVLRFQLRAAQNRAAHPHRGDQSLGPWSAETAQQPSSRVDEIRKTHRQLGLGWGKGRRRRVTLRPVARVARPLTGLKGLAIVRDDGDKRRMAKADLERHTR